MSKLQKQTTVVSTKGQVILPAALRLQRHWGPGTELTVEDTKDGVLLRAVRPFAPTKPQDAFRLLACKGNPRSVADMKAGIATEAKRRHARNRY